MQTCVNFANAKKAARIEVGHDDAYEESPTMLLYRRVVVAMKDCLEQPWPGSSSRWRGLQDPWSSAQRALAKAVAKREPAQGRTTVRKYVFEGGRNAH